MCIISLVCYSFSTFVEYVFCWSALLPSIFKVSAGQKLGRRAMNLMITTSRHICIVKMIFQTPNLVVNCLVRIKCHDIDFLHILFKCNWAYAEICYCFSVCEVVYWKMRVYKQLEHWGVITCHLTLTAL